MAKPTSNKILQDMLTMFEMAKKTRNDVDELYARASEMVSGYAREFDDYREDQSAILLPDAEDFVRTTISALKSALLNANPWVRIEMPSDDLGVQAMNECLSRITEYELDNAKFFENFKYGAFRALLAGFSAARISYENYDVPIGLPEDDMLTTEQQGRLCIDNIDPAQFWLDPSGHGRFYIERKKVTIGEFKDNAEAWGYTNWKDVKPGMIEAESLDDNKDLLEFISLAGREESPYVELLEFCGELYTVDGERLCKNGSIVIANRTTIVKQPKDYPYWHNETPYVVMRPMNFVKDGYPRSVLWSILDLIIGTSTMFNLTIEHAYRSLPYVTMYSAGILSDPEEWLYGISPGQTIEVDNPQYNPVQTVSTNANPLPTMQSFSYMQQQLQTKLSGLVQAGLPSGRGRQTATEVSAAQAVASGLVADLLEGITDTYLVPLVRKSIYLLLQYRPLEEWKSPKWKYLLGSNYDKFIEVMESGDYVKMLQLLYINIQEPMQGMRRRTTAETLIAVFKNFSQAGAGYLNIPMFMTEIMRNLGITAIDFINKDINWQSYALALVGRGMGGQIAELAQAGQPQPPQQGVPSENGGMVAYNQPTTTGGY